MRIFVYISIFAYAAWLVIHTLHIAYAQFFLQDCLGSPHPFIMWASPLATPITIRWRNFCRNILVQSCNLLPSFLSPCRAICLPYAATINSCKVTMSVPNSPYVVATAARNTGSCALDHPGTVFSQFIQAVRINFF